MTPQEKLKARLETLGLPYREINVYGSQITIEAVSRDTADKWASLVQRFAKLRGVIEDYVEAKENKNTVMNPTRVHVWRVYARV